MRRHILVDMTPLAPMGQNGGAGLVATSVVRELGLLAPEMHFTLLTNSASHAEMGSLDAANISRVLVEDRSRFRSLGRRLIDNVLPLAARTRIKRAARRVRMARSHARIIHQVRPDLLFCPFTVPYFRQANVPCICVIYDMQHVTYPQFFTPELRLNREQHIVEACKYSERLICISDYVRSTLLQKRECCAERALAIPLGLLQSLDQIDDRVLEAFDLRAGQFLLYPANFWPHKNHESLFEALRLYLQGHPDSSLKLVCTGAPSSRMAELEALAGTSLPPHRVVFTGYIPQEQLAALLSACVALIFPSLYEGFGMPVLEAMSRGKPVLCSDRTSLPEVCGDAAVYFDPTAPRQISAAIEALEDAPRIAACVARGRVRAARFGTGREMAERYLAVFETVLSAERASDTLSPPDAL